MADNSATKSEKDSRRRSKTRSKRKSRSRSSTSSRSTSSGHSSDNRKNDKKKLVKRKSSEKSNASKPSESVTDRASSKQSGSSTDLSSSKQSGSTTDRTDSKQSGSSTDRSYRYSTDSEASGETVRQAGRDWEDLHPSLDPERIDAAHFGPDWRRAEPKFEPRYSVFKQSCVNGVSQAKKDTQCYFEHRKKIITAKSMVDNKPPPVFNHIICNVNKLREEQVKQEYIEKSNKELLDRLVKVMKTTRVDTWNHKYEKESERHTKLREKQRREVMTDVMKLAAQNEKILRRMNETKPSSGDREEAATRDQRRHKNKPAIEEHGRHRKDRDLEK